MNGSLSHFRAILQRQKERSDATSGRFKRQKSYYDASSKLEFKSEELSEGELNSLKNSIRTKLKTRKKIEAIVLITLIIISLASIIYFVN